MTTSRLLTSNLSWLTNKSTRVLQTKPKQPTPTPTPAINLTNSNKCQYQLQLTTNSNYQQSPKKTHTRHRR
eukprot:m.90038 g.90038  ORF g.90038 m.90038 type:complete len:71 (-) comp26358_c1_seq1:232-444(-)